MTVERDSAPGQRGSAELDARLLRAAVGFALGLILIAIAWLPAHAFADAAW